MPAVAKFQSTPNPNAIKCVLSEPVSGGPFPRSYFTSSDVGADPLAAKLFSLAGVTNVLIHETWVTIGKAPEAEWAGLKPRLEAIFAESARG